MRRSHRLGIITALLLTVLAGVWFYEYRAVKDIGTIEVVMCPACEAVFASEVAGGGDIHCALYDVGSDMAVVLERADAEVITDDETDAVYGEPYFSDGLMHNKFCVINGTTVVTGSYNPTNSGEDSRNNLLIIRSERLAKNYLAEYESMELNHPRLPIRHTITLNGTRVENYFCPNDGCEDEVLSELEAAQEEIVFMTYSFTSDPIGELLEAKAASGVHVDGMCEPQQMDQYSECERVGALAWDGPALLHHKVFIIDRKTVITGSYNPTANGDRRNRENVLIIESPALAAQYLAEYDDVRSAVE